MELVTEGKNFRLVQEDELPDVLDYLTEHLPESLKFHQTIKTYLHDRVWEFHFYVCKSWPEDPVIVHFPGITGLPGGRLYDSFSVFCPVSRLDSLQLLAEEDQLVDWSRPLFLNFTHSRIVEKIEEFCGHRLGAVDKIRGDIYVCERGLARGRHERRLQRRRNRAGGGGGEGSAERQRNADKCVKEEEEPASSGACVQANAEGGPEEDGAVGPRDESGGGGKDGGGGGGEATEEEEGGEKPPLEDVKEEADGLLDEAQLRQLEPEHAIAIHSLYPANDMESVEVFERLIQALPAFGVFSSDGELAAWMVQSYYGAMFSMQTLPAFRRRGYGLLLARRLTSAVLARGYIPFVVIRPENSASQSLYAKLGFRRRYETVRAILRPKGWPRGPEEGAVAGDEAVVPEAGVAAAEEELLAEAEVPEQVALQHKAPKGPVGDLREAEVPEVGGAD